MRIQRMVLRSQKSEAGADFLPAQSVECLVVTQSQTSAFRVRRKQHERVKGLEITYSLPICLCVLFTLHHSSFIIKDTLLYKALFNLYLTVKLLTDTGFCVILAKTRNLCLGKTKKNVCQNSYLET